MATYAEEAAYCTRRVARSTALAWASTDRCARAAHAGMAAAYGARLAALTHAGAPAIVPAAAAPADAVAAGHRSLFRWDREGAAMAPDPPGPVPRAAATEPAALAARVAALENVIVAMLAGGPGDRRAVIHDMALFIPPAGNGGTIDVAALMDRLADRAAAFACAPGEGARASD